MKKVLSIFLVSACLVTSVYPYDRVTVTRDGINVRVDSTVSSQSLGYLNKGERLDMIDQNFEWVKIRLPRRFSCYVSVQYVNRITDALGRVTASSLNLRDKPSLDSNVLGKVQKGDRLTILEEVDGWYKVEGYPYLSGWVHGKFLEGIVPGEESSIVTIIEDTQPTPSIVPSQESNQGDTHSIKEESDSESDPFAPKFNNG